MSFRAFTKNRIRTRVRELRKRLSDTHRRSWSMRVCRQVLQLPYVHKAQTIMLYRAFQNEVDLDSLFPALWKQHKRLCVPRVQGADIHAYEVHDLLEDFEIGYAGISEPRLTLPEINAADIDLILVPGCAFDTEGDRIGWGKGFYDRFLSQEGCHGLKIAIGYNFQILQDIPAEKGDVRMDILVTESKIISFFQESSYAL